MPGEFTAQPLEALPLYGCGVPLAGVSPEQIKSFGPPGAWDMPRGTEQAEQVMKNLGAVLAANGIGYENTIKTTCFLADMSDFGVFNEVYAKYFTGKPARSCVAVKQRRRACSAKWN